MTVPEPRKPATAAVRIAAAAVIYFRVPTLRENAKLLGAGA